MFDEYHNTIRDDMNRVCFFDPDDNAIIIMYVFSFFFRDL